MFDPITLAALSAIPAVAQGVTGLVQSQRSKDILKNLKRPTYAIPEAQTQALNRSKNLASSMQMAGQANVEQRLDQASANALYDINQNSSSGVEALAALSGVYGNQMAQENQLGLNAAQDYQSRQNVVLGELNKYAGYQDKAWDYNVNQPFQEKAAAAQALGEAGMRNKYEGMKGVVGAGVMGMKMQNANEDNAAWLKAFQDKKSSLPADALTQNYSTNTPKSLEEFGKSLEGATSLSKLLNPNITGYNQYGQPQFNNSLGKPFGVLENKAMNTPQLTPNVVEELNVPKIAQKEASLLPQKPLTAEMIAKAPELLSVVGKKDTPVISPIQSKSNVNGLGNSSKQPLDAIKFLPSLQKFAEQNAVSTDPQKNRELAYQELHDSIVSSDKFKSEGPVHPDALRRFSGLTIERDDKNYEKYEWVKDSKGKWVVQDFDPTVGRKSGEYETAYTDAHGNLVHPEDPIRVLEDLGSVYHSNWKKTDGSLDTEALDKLKKIGFTTEELGRLLVGNDRFASKNTNTNTLAKEFPEYFNKENNPDTPKERQNIKTSTPQYKYVMDDILTKGFQEVNRSRGTNFTIEDEKKAIESYFEEGRNLDETDKFNNRLKEQLKSRKKTHPDLFGDIVDDEGNYIGGNK